MSRSVDVRISPKVGRAPLGATATFTCHALLRDDEAAETFSWEAAVQIANETRYSYEDARRKVVHITDLQGRDNNTDVICNVLTSHGRKGRGSGKILVETVRHSIGDLRIPSTPTAGLRPQDTPTASTGRRIGTTSPLNGSPYCFALGAALGGMVLFMLFLMVQKMYRKWTARRETGGKKLVKERVLKRSAKEMPATWCAPADKGGTTRGMQTYATLDGTRSTPTYQVLGPAGLGKGCSASLPPNMGSKYREGILSNGVPTPTDYENVFWEIYSPNFHSFEYSSSLLAQHAHHSLVTFSSRHSLIDTLSEDSGYFSSRLLRQSSHSYENVLPAQHEYENCPSERLTNDVTYVDLDFENSREPARIADTDSKPIEYSKVTKILSVHRSRRGSTRVTVIETDNVIE